MDLSTAWRMCYHDCIANIDYSCWKFFNQQDVLHETQWISLSSHIWNGWLKRHFQISFTEANICFLSILLYSQFLRTDVMNHFFFAYNSSTLSTAISRPIQQLYFMTFLYNSCFIIILSHQTIGILVRRAYSEVLIFILSIKIIMSVSLCNGDHVEWQVFRIAFLTCVFFLIAYIFVGR